MSHSFVAIQLLNFFKNAKFHFYCSRELSVFGLKQSYSPSKKGSHQKIFRTFIKINIFAFFDFWIFFICYVLGQRTEKKGRAHWHTNILVSHKGREQTHVDFEKRWQFRQHCGWARYGNNGGECGNGTIASGKGNDQSCNQDCGRDLFGVLVWSWGGGGVVNSFLWHFMSSWHTCMKICHIEALSVLYAIKICGVTQKHLEEFEGDCPISWGFGGVAPISEEPGRWEYPPVWPTPACGGCATQRICFLVYTLKYYLILLVNYKKIRDVYLLYEWYNEITYIVVKLVMFIITYYTTVLKPQHTKYFPKISTYKIRNNVHNNFHTIFYAHTV